MNYSIYVTDIVLPLLFMSRRVQYIHWTIIFMSQTLYYLHYSCNVACNTVTELFYSCHRHCTTFTIHVMESAQRVHYLYYSCHKKCTTNYSWHEKCPTFNELFMSQSVQERHWTIHVTENALPVSILGICPWLHGYQHQVSSAWWHTAIFCFGPSWPWRVLSPCRKEWCGKRWSICNSRQKKMYTLLAKCRQY